VLGVVIMLVLATRADLKGSFILGITVVAAVVNWLWARKAGATV
jgi:hypothetical protein